MKISPSFWTNGLTIGNKTRELDEITFCLLYEHLQDHEMHIKGNDLILKGEDMKVDLKGNVDQEGRAIKG